jgi:uncharacterized protein
MFNYSPPLAWRNYDSTYQLCGVKCTKCSNMFYPKKHLCSCGSKEFEKQIFAGRGKLMSFTQILVPPREFSSYHSYCLGLIKLEEGPQLIAQVTDTPFEELKIGMDVCSVLRRYTTAGRQGIIHYGAKFIPEGF